jgi:hypothetical protein
LTLWFAALSLVLDLRLGFELPPYSTPEAALHCRNRATAPLDEMSNLAIKGFEFISFCFRSNAVADHNFLL